MELEDRTVINISVNNNNRISFHCESLEELDSITLHIIACKIEMIKQLIIDELFERERKET